MSRKSINRSLIQLAFVCSAILFLGTAIPTASALDECDDQAAACEQKCGGTWTYDYQYTYWDECATWIPPNCFPGDVDHYEWTWHPNAIDYFECQPGNGHGICECAY